MESRYLVPSECLRRLVAEYKKYGSLIVAVDFDNTLYDFHGVGDTFHNIIELLRLCKEFDFHITIFTSCNEDRYEFIRQYMKDNDIPFDAINETPDFIPYKGRKVYYNILLDDRAGLESAYKTLWTVITQIRSERSFAASEVSKEIG